MLEDQTEKEAAALRKIYDEVIKKERKMSQAEFGRISNIGSQGTVWQYLNGRIPLNMRAASRFARAMGVAVSDFSPRLAQDARVAYPINEPETASGYGIFRKTTTTSTAISDDRLDHVKLPVLEAFPSAGNGGEPVDYPAVLDYMELPVAWAKHNLGNNLAAYQVLPVRGDSMSPTLNEGDVVFVDTSVRSFDSDGIYVLVWHDQLLIKRLCALLTTQNIEIRSDNHKAYGTELIKPSELSDLFICGKVKCWWSFKTA